MVGVFSPPGTSGQPSLFQIRLGGHRTRAQLPPDCVSRVPGMLDGSLRRQAVGSRLDQHP